MSATFRFEDQHAQTLLVADLVEHAIEHEVVEDGAVEFEDEQGVELAIGRVVEAVLGARDFYRTRIDDENLAERYRRFKRRVRTGLVEEVRNGEHWFVQEIKEKRYRHDRVPTHAALVLMGPHVDPERISALLSVDRHLVTLIRDRTKHQGMGGCEVTTVDVVASNDGDEHLSRLWNLVGAGIARVDDAHVRRILRIEVVRPRATSYWLTLRSDVMAKWCSACDSVDLRCLPDDYL